MENVVSKIKKMFPKLNVWMIEAYDTKEINKVDFELYTNENVLQYKDIIHLNISSILFDSKCISVEVSTSYFTEVEHKQLLFLTSLDLKEYNHSQMEEIINSKFN